MRGYNVAPLEIQRAIAGSNVRVTAGEFTQSDTAFVVESGRVFASPDDLRQLVAGVFNNSPVFLKDVASIVDGPDEDCDKTIRTILCALACAHTSVKILTPYFLPSTSLITALNTTASRGVAVDIILPRVNNLRWVGWAMMAQLWQVLEWGCHVWLSPPPFDHSKLLLVDDEWSLVGSANWDARSLRLNFEFNVECYCPNLARSLGVVFEQKRTAAQRIRLEDADKRSAMVKFRDSFARLFTPYL